MKTTLVAILLVLVALVACSSYDGEYADTSVPTEEYTPVPSEPYCGSLCASNEDCAGLGVNPICGEGYCYDAQACGDAVTPEPTEDYSPFICPNRRNYVDGAEPYADCVEIVTGVETHEPIPTEEPQE